MSSLSTLGSEAGPNLAVLDDLVLSFLGSERLVAPSSEDPAREACKACHDHMAAGRVDTALQLAEQIHQDIFGDQRLLFRIKKQQFTELLRVRDIGAATELLRQELAPLALDAYPEAYGEFKRAMLQFVYVPPQQKEEEEEGEGGAGEDAEGRPEPTPVGDDTSLAAREHAAKVLDRTLRQAVGIHGPPLVLLLHYLHQCWRASAKINFEPPFSPSEDILELFDTAERDPPGMSQGEGFMRTFPESEVQALAHAVDIPRQTAEQSLRQADGDAVVALKNELSRLRINTAELDTMVHEYASYRGLIRTAKGRTPEDNGSAVVPMDVCEGPVDEAAADERETELRWVGRGGGEAATCNDEEMLEENSRQYAATVHLRGLVSKGLVDDVVDGVQSLDGGFFEGNPQLLFELKRCKFLRQVEAGDIPGALALARGDLGPLAERCPGLLTSLKRTLATLLEREPDTKPATSVIASALQDALRESLGLAEPRLVKILRYLLDVHTNWFRKEQRCKDNFEVPLGLADLKDAAPLPSAAHARGNGSLAGGNFAAGAEDADSGSDDEEDDGRPTEEAILTLMEFMAMSRPLAIDYLTQYDGSAETVIAQLLG